MEKIFKLEVTDFKHRFGEREMFRTGFEKGDISEQQSSFTFYLRSMFVFNAIYWETLTFMFPDLR